MTGTVHRPVELVVPLSQVAIPAGLGRLHRRNHGWVVIPRESNLSHALGR